MFVGPLWCTQLKAAVFFFVLLKKRQNYNSPILHLEAQNLDSQKKNTLQARLNVHLTKVLFVIFSCDLFLSYLLLLFLIEKRPGVKIKIGSCPTIHSVSFIKILTGQFKKCVYIKCFVLFCFCSVYQGVVKIKLKVVPLSILFLFSNFDCLVTFKIQKLRRNLNGLSPLIGYIIK